MRDKRAPCLDSWLETHGSLIRFENILLSSFVRVRQTKSMRTKILASIFCTSDAHLFSLARGEVKLTSKMSVDCYSIRPETSQSQEVHFFYCGGPLGENRKKQDLRFRIQLCFCLMLYQELVFAHGLSTDLLITCRCYLSSICGRPLGKLLPSWTMDYGCSHCSLSFPIRFYLDSASLQEGQIFSSCLQALPSKIRHLLSYYQLLIWGELGSHC